MKKYYLFFFVTAIILSVTATSCNRDVSGVVIDPPIASLAVGERLVLTAAIKPSNASDKTVTWESSDTEVVTVINGTVTAKYPGTALITVTTSDGNYTATSEITVFAPVTGLTFDRTTVALRIGDEETLTAKIIPEYATNDAVSWTSSNPGVANVIDGTVTAVGEGMTIITATTDDGNYAVSCTITVIDANCIIQMTTIRNGEVEIWLNGIGNATVDWGDGSEKVSMDITRDLDSYRIFRHQYSNTDERTITIYGDNIRQMRSNNNGIRSLDISRNATLRTLECFSNALTILDVSNNTELTYMRVHFNQLTSLDVSNNIELSYLVCNNNQLTALDVSNNTTLTNLFCGENPLTSLDVSNNTALSSLCCHHNQLTSLDVSKNTALEALYCNNNQLTALDVSNNTALTWLHCFNNQLTALDVSNNTTLTWFYCNNNRLAALDVSNNTALTWLHCQNNLFTAFALNVLFETLHSNINPIKTIRIFGNPGAANCNQSIATAKGWEVNTTN